MQYVLGYNIAVLLQYTEYNASLQVKVQKEGF